MDFGGGLILDEQGMTLLAFVAVGLVGCVVWTIRIVRRPLTPEWFLPRIAWMQVLASRLYDRCEHRFGASSPITEALCDLMCAADDCAARIRKYVEVGQ